jgi:hypothetical protein
MITATNEENWDSQAIKPPMWLFECLLTSSGGRITLTVSQSRLIDLNGAD